MLPLRRKEHLRHVRVVTARRWKAPDVEGTLLCVRNVGTYKLRDSRAFFLDPFFFPVSSTHCSAHQAMHVRVPNMCLRCNYLPRGRARRLLDSVCAFFAPWHFYGVDMYVCMCVFEVWSSLLSQQSTYNIFCVFCPFTYSCGPFRFRSHLCVAERLRFVLVSLRCAM